MLTKQADLLLSSLHTMQLSHADELLQARRGLYKIVDSYMQKESDLTPEAIQGKYANEHGDKRAFRDAEIPISFIQTQTALASLTGTFLGGEPVFVATANKENEQAASQMTALSQRDQHRLGWRGQLLFSLQNALKYNIAPTEVLWGAKRSSSVATTSAATSAETPRTGELSSVVYEGNMIRALDPYNFFCDTSVDPYELHEFGAFAGYIQRMNYIRMKKFFHELTNTFVVKHNVKEAFGSSAGNSKYYKPSIRADLTVRDPNDWTGFWGNDPSIDPANSLGKYEVVTTYSRVIPKEYKLDLPRPGQLRVIKTIYVNGVLLYMEPLHLPHEFLPIIVGQMYRGPWETKSFTEYVLDLQDLATGMVKGTMDSMRRAVSDRGIYDPTRLRKADIDSLNPVAKIPVASNAYNSDIRTAYHQIPYEDRATGAFQNNLSLIFSIADQTTGLNQSAQGNFIKGNKTLFEFDQIMSNAQARIQLGAVELEESMFAPIKEVIKLNFLVNSQAETLDDGISNEAVEIDPVLLRKVAPEFKMADGVLPATKIANSEVLQQAIAFISQDPRLPLEYDTGGMIISILKQQGLHDLDSYKRTPEQQQQFQQGLQAQAAAQDPNAQQSPQQPPQQGQPTQPPQGN